MIAQLIRRIRKKRLQDVLDTALLGNQYREPEGCHEVTFELPEPQISNTCHSVTK
jgi:hypothetical protein